MPPHPSLTFLPLQTCSTLHTALTYVLAPLPNSVCSRCAGADDFSADYNSGFVDFGNFLTGMMIVSGVALPLALAHSGVIAPAACIMSIAGGALVYGTSEYRHLFNPLLSRNLVADAHPLYSLQPSSSHILGLFQRHGRVLS